MFVYVVYILKAHRQHLLELGTSCSLVFYYPSVNNRLRHHCVFRFSVRPLFTPIFLTQCLRTVWREFSETCHRYSSCEWELLKKFSRSEVIGQRSYMYSCASAIMADAYISTTSSRDSLFVCVFFVVKAALSACEILVLWRSGSAWVSIIEVNLRRARLALRWVTMSGFNTRCRTLILVCNQPPRPAQPSWVGK